MPVEVNVLQSPLPFGDPHEFVLNGHVPQLIYSVNPVNSIVMYAPLMFFKTGARKLQHSPAPFRPDLSIFGRSLSPSLPLLSCSCTQSAMHHQPHPEATGAITAYGGLTTGSDLKRGKKRGSYNCGRCGLPKKGHSCHSSTGNTAVDSPSTSSSTPSAISNVRPPPRQPYSQLRRALSFDNVDVPDIPKSDENDFPGDLPELGSDLDSGPLPGNCMWEVLRRLPPPTLLSAAKVCKGWRECTRRLWRAAEELRLRVPERAQVGSVGSLLQKCPGLVRLSLRMERLSFIRRSY